VSAHRTDPASDGARKASFARTARTVFWSFFGVRRASDHEKETAQLNPVHVIVAGIVGAALFVLALVALVQWVTRSGLGS
jgi:hypothetical protein